MAPTTSTNGATFRWSKMSRILRNAIRCMDCGDEIESTHRHDFVTCKCGAVSVDGGKDYLRRVGTRWVEMSKSEVEKDDQ